MRVFDLCTEFGSETAAFRDRGHEVVMLGIEYLDFDFETMRTELDKVQLMLPNKESIIRG